MSVALIGCRSGRKVWREGRKEGRKEGRWRSDCIHNTSLDPTAVVTVAPEVQVGKEKKKVGRCRVELAREKMSFVFSGSGFSSLVFFSC